MKMSAVNVTNIKQRIGLINRFIQEGRKDPQIRQLVSRIMTAWCGRGWCVPEKQWQAEVSAVFYWVRANVRYTLDPYSLELFQRAQRIVQLKMADCDDQVILSGAMLQTIGYPLRIVIIDTGDDSGWNHVYLHVGIPPTDPTKWISFDLTAIDQPLGWEMPSSMINKKKAFEVQGEDD